jgi:hypothetical protein
MRVCDTEQDDNRGVSFGMNAESMCGPRPKLPTKWAVSCTPTRSDMQITSDTRSALPYLKIGDLCDRSNTRGPVLGF